MEQRAAAAAYGALHEGEGKRPFHDGTFTNWAAEWSPTFPYRYDDGVSINVSDRDLTPWDEFTTRTNASPLPPSVAEQAPGEQDEAADEAADHDDAEQESERH